MSSVIKNTFILGVALLFGVIFWVFYEVVRAESILAQISSPEESVKRGFAGAEQDYTKGYVRFLRWGDEVPGLTREELNGKYLDYAPYYGLWRCVVGAHTGVSQFAIDRSAAEFNEYYVTAYNRRLKTIIDSGI